MDVISKTLGNILGKKKTVYSGGKKQSLRQLEYLHSASNLRKLDAISKYRKRVRNARSGGKLIMCPRCKGGRLVPIGIGQWTDCPECGGNGVIETGTV